MTAEERKQAEEIDLNKIIEEYLPKRYYGHEARRNAKRAAESYASLKVAEVTKEMYPKAYVEWLTEPRNIAFLWSKSIPMRIDELFEYWKQNIRKPNTEPIPLNGSMEFNERDTQIKGK